MQSVFNIIQRIPFDAISSPELSSQFIPCKIGDSFGPSWSTHWFRLELTLSNLLPEQEVHLIWDSSSEAMVWVDGQPQQGLTGGNGGDRRAWFPLRRTDRRQQIYVEMSCNAMFGA